MARTLFFSAMLFFLVCLPGPALGENAGNEADHAEAPVEATEGDEAEKLSEEVARLREELKALEIERLQTEIAHLGRELESLREGLRGLERYLRENIEANHSDIRRRLASERSERRSDTSEILRRLREIQFDVRTHGSGARIPFRID